MDEHVKPKTILSKEIYGRNTLRTTKKTLDNGRGGRPQEDEHPRLASEDPRSTGLEEDCVGGQGPYWTVAPHLR